MRMTAKYRAALRTAKEQFGRGYPTSDQEALYAYLQMQNFYWDHVLQKWIDLSEKNDPSPPTNLLRIRCWSDSEIIEELADLVSVELLKHFDLVDRSNAYTCRPPKQLESRIYLSFKKKGG